MPGETGLLIPMEDAPGRQRVQERFTISLTAGKMERLYEYLLK